MLSTNQNAGLFGQQHILVELIDILDFCTVIKERQDLVLPFSIQCDQLRLLFKQTAGLFDHQYLWKLIFILIFLYGVTHQGKLALGTNTF